jgi:hypothetical protein
MKKEKEVYTVDVDSNDPIIYLTLPRADTIPIDTEYHIKSKKDQTIIISQPSIRIYHGREREEDKT